MLLVVLVLLHQLLTALSSAAVLGKRDDIFMQMRMKSSADFGSDLGKPIDLRIDPEQYGWGHGGCLKFQVDDFVRSALTSNGSTINFQNNDEVTDWLIDLEHVDATCTVGFFVPNPFIVDTPYSEQPGCGILQNKVDQFGKKVNIPMQFERQFGIQFCCGHDDCAAMLPSNDRDMAWANKEQPDVVYKDDSAGCAPARGKHKKDGPILRGRSFSFPGKQIYASNWINCGGAELESCTLTSYPALQDTQGTTSTLSSGGSTGHDIQTNNQLKWFSISETSVSATVSDTYTYTRSVNKNHQQVVSATEMYSVHCQPGQTCAIAFTPKAVATEMSQCLKDGTLRHWTEYNLDNLNGIQEVQGQYSVVYKD